MLWLVITAIVVVVLGAAILAAKYRERSALAPEVQAALSRARDARNELQRVQKSQQKDVKQASKRLNAEQDPRGRRLESGGGAVLFERHITTPQGSGNLVGVVATAADESQVVQRLTVTRMVGLGVFSLAAPKRKTVGNAYVVIEGPSVSGVATFSGGSKAGVGVTAYKFAAAVNNAARAAASDEPERPARIDAAQRDLAAAQDPTKVLAAEQLFNEAVAALPSEHRAKFKKEPEPEFQTDDMEESGESESGNIPDPQ